VVKLPDYYSGSRGFETLPSDIYLFKNFTAADSGGGPILLHLVEQQGKEHTLLPSCSRREVVESTFFP